jgi:Flp pilus assembly protein TadG
MVEFALVSGVFFLLMFGFVDFGRLVAINTSVADAARQAARQGAANAVRQGPGNADPWDPSPSGVCSGTVLTMNATGSGCLTDIQMRNTVARVMKDWAPDAQVVLVPWPICSAPAAGQVTVCISPLQKDRNDEWTTPNNKGKYLIQVTVTMSVQTLTPASSVIGSNFTLSSTSATLAEY